MAMFDLPVDSRKMRKAATRFRKSLLERGFSMLQFSVYARFFQSQEASETYRKQIHYEIPECGSVRLITLTDAQFGKMEVFDGKKRQDPEAPPGQLLLF